MMNKFFLSLLLFATVFIIACSDSNQNVNSQTGAANANQSAQSDGTQANGSKVVKAEGTVAVIPQNSNRPGPPATDPAITGKAPKLFLPVTNADYGKVKLEKSFTRTFDVKNTGNAPLNIEAVTPG
jgi:hypothetical protein